MRTCIFVDGENLRFSIGDLYPDFNKMDYLPKEAEWGELFDYISVLASGERDTRLRTYWYVMNDVDPYPRPIQKHKRTQETVGRWKTKHFKVLKETLEGVPDNKVYEKLNNLNDTLELERIRIKSRFDGFRTLQNGIAKKHKSIEFRRSGSISYDLIRKKLHSEKTVDVNLAVDMVTLANNYDLAVIVSGDQDYVPAAQAIKNMGKQVVNVAFEARNGILLPGGAKQLNYTTDWSVAVQWKMLGSYLRI